MTSVKAFRGGILAPALAFLERGDVERALKAYLVLRKQNPTNVPIVFNFANALAARGHNERAEREYRVALELDPRAADISNNLAIVLGELGRHEEAEAVCSWALRYHASSAPLLRTRALQFLKQKNYERAQEDVSALLKFAPAMPDAHNLQGDVLANQHRWGDAIAAFKRAVELSGYARPFRVNLATAYAASGGLAEAAGLFTAALKEDKRDYRTMDALAAVLQRMNKHKEAIRACELALSVQPDFADAHNRIAQSYLSMEVWDKAIATAQDVLDRHPEHLEALFNLGMALVGARRYAEAVECFDRILAAGPTDDMALLNLGNALAGAGRLEDAIGAYSRMIERLPTWAGGYLNIGHVYGKQRKWDKALESYRKAFELEPEKTDHLYSIGNVYLHLGDFAEGWKGYEHRNQSKEGVQRRFPDLPVWDGEDLVGKRLLVFGEQGLGDNVQMARYLPLLQQRGAIVAFHGYPMLRALFQTSAPGLQFADDPVNPKDFDFQVASMSLPFKFETRVDNVPQNVPYFFAEPERVARWKQRIGTEGFRIGINWQGNPSGKIDEGRSAPLKQFLRFATVPGVRIVSMQKNHGLDQLADVPEHINVELLGDDFDTGKDAFLDTLAVMANLDLVVTTDTSLAHVAGGFGARVFVALKDNPDWRWMYDRDDSPWYPTARLFRQTEFNVWDDVFARMTEAISELASGSNREGRHADEG